jgi:MoCo/4Fe-4S cofactor protein with predicted Tat translocation signal
MSPKIEQGTKRYWRSLDEIRETPEFRTLVEREFPGRTWETLAPATRRQFLKVMGASIALAGLAGCRWPVEKIVPFARPAGYTPGSPLQFTTAMETGGVAQGLLVTSYDGRPIKIEGNPNHPHSRGASDSFAQASVLELYDPSRSRSVVRRDGGRRSLTDWDAFESFARDRFGTIRRNGGAGLRVLSEATSSPSTLSMRDLFIQTFPQARWVEYEPISRDNERAGSTLAFGRPYRTHMDLEKADVIVCLDADILMTHPASIRHARDFAAGRRADDGGMNRLYVIEATHSVTGSVADHRFPVSQGSIPHVLGRLAGELYRQGLAGPEGRVPSEMDFFSGPHPAYPFLRNIAEDLLRNRGKGVIVTGPRVPAEIHALVHLLNDLLGNVGSTVHYTAEPDPDRPSHVQAIQSLADEIRSGRVETLLILGGNPAYDAPADVEFAKALDQVPVAVRLGLFEDETSRACAWHLPRAHYLESWGDARAYDGAISIVQPLIAPLYQGRTPIEVLSLATNDSLSKGYDVVRRTLASRMNASDFEAAWSAALNEGIVPDTAFAATVPGPVNVPAILGQFAALTIAPTPDSSGGNAGGSSGAISSGSSDLEIIFSQDMKVYDGRFANNSWLQELPEPMTKLTWDNAALIAPSTAASLGIKADDVVTLRYRGRSLDLPVYVMPGEAAGTVAVSLGYGRTAAGDVGDKVGGDTYLLRTSGALHFDRGLTLAPAGRKHKLACTQEHHAIDLVGLRAMNRRVGELVRSADLTTYKKNPEFAKESGESPPAVSLWKEPDLTSGHQWGMSIDLSSCIGCGACALACQAENNVPVVGKAEVLRSREMHWLRIDRYFTGDPEDPAVVHQPVACVQCENAPCEQVCPVNATVHSHEGLNQMVYNRCVGTRYCSNNCPYKVRRFNWFNNHRNLTEIEKMVYNPDVTVRSRGVMEKCTYCVQRIETVKISSKNAGREIRDGEIVPACAQACPTRAIVFGDLSDKSSKVLKLHGHPRSYGMLAEINTQPRTLYMARLTNPTDGLEKAPGGSGEEHEGHAASPGTAPGRGEG